ncbi:MAG: VIT1/CCC1 transporter family protein [Candidatus Colwellbacteria bacterium]|nr:VIT1/CCC1 transporter family protein [Candidatus Colwellbacteria bacterium]
MGNIISRHIKDIIFGANDGIVTTFAVVAGAMGAGLSARVVIIMGIANLLADGFSMGAGNYLGSVSEEEVAEEGGQKHRRISLAPAIFTFVSFVLAGLLPLLPFIFGAADSFVPAIVTTGLALFVVGALLGHIVLRRHWLFLGFQMLFVGGTAAGIAYSIGYLVESILSL